MLLMSLLGLVSPKLDIRTLTVFPFQDSYVQQRGQKCEDSWMIQDLKYVFNFLILLLLLKCSASQSGALHICWVDSLTVGLWNSLFNALPAPHCILKIFYHRSMRAASICGSYFTMYSFFCLFLLMFFFLVHLRLLLDVSSFLHVKNILNV